MRKILITGGAGFIGSQLSLAFHKKGYQVVILDNFSTALNENVKKIDKKIKVYKVDILDKNLTKIFQKEKPDFVSHHAAQIKVITSFDDPQFDARTNILGTINVLEASVKANVKKIIFASSGGAIYGEVQKKIPTEKTLPRLQSPYAISKLSAEYYIKMFYEKYRLPYVVFRYSNVYGPGQRGDNEGGAIAIFVNRIIKNKKITIFGDGEQTRDFVYISDIVSANERALKSTMIGTYNVSTGKASSINRIINLLHKKSSNKKNVTYAKAREGEVRKSVLNANLLKKDAQWIPSISLSEGLDHMLSYYKETI